MSKLHKVLMIGNVLGFLAAIQFGEIMTFMEKIDIPLQMRQSIATLYALVFGIEALAFTINAILGIILSASTDESNEDSTKIYIHWGAKALWYVFCLPFMSMLFWILNDVFKGLVIDIVWLQALISYGVGYSIQLLTIVFIKL